MALVECEQCGGRISSKARSCPKCGAVREGGPAPRAAAEEPVQRAKVAELRPVSASRQNAEPAPDQPRARVAELRPVAKTTSDAAPLAAAPEPPPIEAWYYVTATGRLGPVTLNHLRTLALSGKIPAETPIWKAGLADWVVLSEYRETEEPASADLPEADLPQTDFLVWALALAPLWGGIVQIAATEVTVSHSREKLAYYSEFWWITVLINILICYLDYYRARKEGQEIARGESWLCLAVPAYLYRREVGGPGKLTKLWIWVGSLAVTLALFMYLNGIYAKIR